MTKSKNTKRALLASVLSMMLCVAMLIGSTFAWFTDTVTSGKNKIVAGNLDVQLLMKASADGDYKDISDSKDPIFGAGSIAQDNNAETLWEPGKTQVAYLAIKNNGNLALKYSVDLNVQNVSKNLYEVMQYDITPNAQYGDVTSWAGNGKSVVPGTQLVSDSDVFLGAGQTHYFALSIHMKEEAGNDYMGGEVDFDLTVFATQATAESDSFGPNYDAGITMGIISKDSEMTLKISDDAAITIPAEAVNEDVKVTFAVQMTEKTESGQTYEISLKDADNNAIKLNTPATVTINAGANKEIAGVKHSGVAMSAATSSTEMTDGTYYYDAKTGILMICTSSFSPFEVEWKLSQAENATKLVEKGYVAVSSQTEFKNAIQAGKAIVLTGDVEAAYSNDVNKVSLSFNNANADVVLDLNGHELKCGPKSGTLVQYSMVVNAGKVTIVDTYGNGKVCNTILVKGTDANLTINDVDADEVAVQDGGKLTVNGGTFANVSGKKSNSTAPIQEVTLNGGVFGAVGCTGGIVNIYKGTTVNGNIGAAGTTYNIYGGTFAKLPNGSSMTVNIYDGYFTDASSYSWNTSTYKFSGGTFGNRTSAFPDKYLAEGKECVKTADKTYSVVDK